jgi:murein L,D-transpeptidase YcbB/YkuD
VEKPKLLAEYLLKDQSDWNSSSIERAMHRSNPVTANLKKKYPVMIEYRTVWEDEEGHLNFREDIYHHDKRQLAQLHKLR